jgi:hypothetical protein
VSLYRWQFATGGNLPPAANLPPISLTPVANLPPVSTTQVELVAKFSAGVLDTGANLPPVLLTKNLKQKIL